MNKGDLLEKIIIDLEKIKQEKPLIHHLTNYVSANDSANITLSLGASPVMADNPAEVEEVIALAGALVLNIGTIGQGKEGGFFKAVRKANQLNIPVVLDPVGVGASSFRKKVVQELLEKNRIEVIKGNLAEIKSILEIPTKVRGVDSADESKDNQKIAQKMAETYRLISVITGEEDVISDGEEIITVKHGHPLMGQLTGTGCMTTSLIGCFLAVEGKPLIAATGGVLLMGLAGEKAAARASGPGSLRWRLQDEIYKIRGSRIKKLAEIGKINLHL
ncbi:MAG: hydroxyethylthiazole kinase [Halanaerobiales bacterium]|nr:hydroxyethylthiazole kinase [Halanaerobiales bacterium]